MTPPPGVTPQPPPGDNNGPLAPDDELLRLHGAALRRTAELVGQIRDDQWDDPTPCGDWNLRALVTHMTTDNRGFAAAAGGETADRSIWTAPVGGDLRRAYRQSAAEVVAAFAASGVLEREFWLPRIASTRMFLARQAIGFHLLDYLVHGWDVAATLAVPFTPPAAEVALVQRIADRDVPSGPRRHHPEAAFGPPVAVPAGAPAMDRLLGFLGRDPHWKPAEPAGQPLRD
jgi:uncharacterized protein (TIGR03086 family)